jgi:hypothetical protein
MSKHSAAYYREWRRRTGRTKTSKAFLDGVAAARQALATADRIRCADDAIAAIDALLSDRANRGNRADRARTLYEVLADEDWTLQKP